MSDSEDDFDDDPSLDEEPIHRAAREGDLVALRRELEAGSHEMVALIVSFWAHVGHY